MSGDGRQQPPTNQGWLPDVPFDISSAAQNLLSDMKGRLEALYTDPTPPGPPTGTSATAVTLGNLIRWNPVLKAAGYRIYRNTSNAFTSATMIQELQGKGNVSWYDSFQAAAASAQYYWVVAVNSAGIAGPTGGMVSVNAGINVNDIFAQNVTATGTITGATIQTSLLNPKVIIDSTNGLRAIDGSATTVLQADLSGNVTVTGGTITGGLIRTAVSGARVALVGASNALISYFSDGTVAGSFGSGGICSITTVIAANTAVSIYDSTVASSIIVGNTTVTIGAGSATRLTISSTAITANSATFTGDGSGLTTLNATNLSSGTVATGRLPTDVVKYGGSAIAGNANFSSGYGVASGGTAVALATNVEAYTSSTLRASFGSGTQISIGGTLYTMSLETADLGTGVKNYINLS